jgi:hypothetical protein
VFYNIVIEFGIPMKLVWLIEMYLKESYSNICIVKQLSDFFCIQNGKNKEILYHYCFLTLL